MGHMLTFLYMICMQQQCGLHTGLHSFPISIQFQHTWHLLWVAFRCHGVLQFCFLVLPRQCSPTTEAVLPNADAALCTAGLVVKQCPNVQCSASHCDALLLNETHQCCSDAQFSCRGLSLCQDYLESWSAFRPANCLRSFSIEFELR